MPCPTTDDQQRAGGLGGGSRTHVADQWLVPMFSVANDRTGNLFAPPDRDETLSLCEDRIRYPDGSCEPRVEAEQLTGDAKTLTKVDRALRKQNPTIEFCKRGKLSEGRAPLWALLG